MARLIGVVGASGVPVSNLVVAAALGLTGAQTQRIAQRALEAGLVDGRNAILQLTPKGHGLARELKEVLTSTRERNRNRSEPYTEYVPRRWSP